MEKAKAELASAETIIPNPKARLLDQVREGYCAVGMMDYTFQEPVGIKSRWGEAPAEP